MKDENYYRERDIKNLEKIERLKGDLPYFIEEFFWESKTGQAR